MATNATIPLSPETTVGAVAPNQRYPLPREIMDIIFLHVREDDLNSDEWKTTLRTAMRASKLIRECAVAAFFLELDFGFKPDYDVTTCILNLETFYRLYDRPELARCVRKIKLSAVAFTYIVDFRGYEMDGQRAKEILKSVSKGLKTLVCLQEAELDVRVLDPLDDGSNDSKVSFWRTVVASLPKRTMHLWLRGSKALILSILAKPSQNRFGNAEDVTLGDFFGRLRTLSIFGQTMYHVADRTYMDDDDDGDDDTKPCMDPAISLSAWFELPKLESLAIDWGHCINEKETLECASLSLVTGPNTLKSLKRLSIRLCNLSADELVEMLTSNQQSLEKIALRNTQLFGGRWEQVFDLLTHCENLRGIHLRRLEYLDLSLVAKEAPIKYLETSIFGANPLRSRRALDTEYGGDLVSLGDLVRYQHGKNNNYLSHRWGRFAPEWYSRIILGRMGHCVWWYVVPCPEVMAEVFTIEDADQYLDRLRLGYEATPVQRFETQEWNRHVATRFEQ